MSGYVVLTPELIQAGVSGPGGWNKAQLAAVGIAWAELKTGGWMTRAAGRKVAVADYRRFIDLRRWRYDLENVFVVLAGTTCRVRRAEGADWMPYVTTRDAVYRVHGVDDNGGTWTFSRDGWVMKVAASLVIGRDRHTEKEDRQHRPRGSFGTSRGKGASRRRNMRATKRRG